MTKSCHLTLRNSIRIYPHLQNTGGFFIAVFEKVKSLTAAGTAEEEVAHVPEKRASPEVVESGRREKRRRADVPRMKEAPFELMSPTNPDIDELT